MPKEIIPKGKFRPERWTVLCGVVLLLCLFGAAVGTALMPTNCFVGADDCAIPVWQRFGRQTLQHLLFLLPPVLAAALLARCLHSRKAVWAAAALPWMCLPSAALVSTVVDGHGSLWLLWSDAATVLLWYGLLYSLPLLLLSVCLACLFQKKAA